MPEALQPWPYRVLQQALATGGVEAFAVVLGFAYIVLAIRQRRACWLFGGLSTALYVFVFLAARLYLQAALQLLYVALAVYGWREWSHTTGGAGDVAVRPAGWRLQLALSGAVGAMTVVTALAMTAFSDAASPWADAAGSWASVAATWLLIRKAAANWLWWMVIDTGLAALFASQGLLFTALLYIAYAALALAGWLTWRRGSEIA